MDQSVGKSLQFHQTGMLLPVTVYQSQKGERREKQRKEIQRKDIKIQRRQKYNKKTQ